MTIVSRDLQMAKILITVIDITRAHSLISAPEDVVTIVS